MGVWVDVFTVTAKVSGTEGPAWEREWQLELSGCGSSQQSKKENLPSHGSK